MKAAVPGPVPTCRGRRGSPTPEGRGEAAEEPVEAAEEAEAADVEGEDEEAVTVPAIDPDLIRKLEEFKRERLGG